MARRHQPWALAGMAALAAVPLLGALGHPVLGYATSASMEPALRVGDGFLVDPFPAALGLGDVVVFHSEVRGGPAVHRIVGGDASGWVTRGDANPVTDQEAGEPPLTPDRVRGRVLALGGAPVVLPSLGVPVIEGQALLRQAERDLGLLGLAAAGLGALALLLLALPAPGPSQAPLPSPRRPARARWAARARRLAPRGLLARHLAGLAVLAAALPALGGLAALHEEVPLQVVVTEGHAPAGQVRSAAPGQEQPRDLQLRGLPLLGTLAVAEARSDRVRLEAAELALAPGAAGHLRAHQRAGAEPGLQEDRVAVWRYPALLPDEATLALHRALPGSPLLLPALALASALALWARTLGLGDLPAACLAPRRSGGALR